MILPIILSIVTMMLCLFGYMFRLAHKDMIRYHHISHQKVPAAFEGFRIFLIADIHRRNIQEATLSRIKKRPDIVCIAGDFTERGVPMDRIRRNIELLKNWHVPIYFVWGNNDHEVDIFQMKQILNNAGVIILEDHLETITREKERIHLIGLDYYMDHEDREPFMDWDTVKDSFTIVLTHKPSAFDHLAHDEKSSVDLVLAGHTHGGQIRFFNIGFYQKGGITEMVHTKILITEGYGYTLLPLRLGTHAECHLITLE